MIHNPDKYRTMPVGIVLRRAPGVTRWQKHAWTAVGVLPGAVPAAWRKLRDLGDVVEYHAGNLMLELHGAETEAYLHNLHAQVPCLYVVMRRTLDMDAPFELLTATVSPYEAQDYTDSGEEVVEKIALPDAMQAWIWDFVETFHQEETFIKRKRDRKRIDLSEDGIGDVRIVQTADVYRAPAMARKERLQ